MQAERQCRLGRSLSLPASMSRLTLREVYTQSVEFPIAAPAACTSPVRLDRTRADLRHPGRASLRASRVPMPARTEPRPPHADVTAHTASGIVLHVGERAASKLVSLYERAARCLEAGLLLIPL